VKFIKKPVVIDAFQLTENAEVPEWARRYDVEFIGPNGSVNLEYRGPFHRAAIKTMEGTMIADLNDWIIKGVKDEIYPCKPDIFQMTYEKI